LQQPPGVAGTALKPDVAGSGETGTVVVAPAGLAGTTGATGGQHGRPVVIGRVRQQS